ncbi:MAG: hypothetical protein ACYDEY_14030, partial [Acidimicrobiales bacterium]
MHGDRLLLKVDHTAQVQQVAGDPLVLVVTAEVGIELPREVELSVSAATLDEDSDDTLGEDEGYPTTKRPKGCGSLEQTGRDQARQ